MNTYWLSFADGKNLGVCIVDARTPEEAHKKSYALGLNPGGEAMIAECPKTLESIQEINELGKNRLISPEELRQKHYTKTTNDLDEETKNKLFDSPGIIVVCEKCNVSHRPNEKCN